MKKYKIIVDGITGIWAFNSKKKESKVKRGDIFVRSKGKFPLYWCERNNVCIYDMRDFVNKKWAKRV